MKVIYYCYGSAHSSVLAAAIHIGMLPSNRIPSQKEISCLPFFDKTNSNQIGTPFYYGTDNLGHQIYILGMGSKRTLVKNTLFNFLELMDISKQKIVLIDALAYVNFWTKIGGFVSRRIGLVSIGRPLTIYTLQKLYYRYLKLVSQVKQRLKQISDAN